MAINLGHNSLYIKEKKKKIKTSLDNTTELNFQIVHIVLYTSSIYLIVSNSMQHPEEKDS